MTERTDTDDLKELLRPYARQCEEDLASWLVEAGTPEPLAEAMRYCVLGGGKRLRPALACMAAEAVGDGSPDELARRCGAAVELVHCYSLVHDDLPAMDDDALRRGKPTAHVRFGEAMAILTGDALLTRAFGILAEADDPRAARLAAERFGDAKSGTARLESGRVPAVDAAATRASEPGQPRRPRALVAPATPSRCRCAMASR